MDQSQQPPPPPRPPPPAGAPPHAPGAGQSSGHSGFASPPYGHNAYGAPPAPNPWQLVPSSGWGAPVSSDDCTMAALAHAVSFVAAIVGPLIFYIVKREQSRFVAFHALQSLFVSLLNLIIGGTITIVTCGLGFPVLFVGLVFHVLGAIRASRGEYYEIPLVGGWARKTVYGH